MRSKFMGDMSATPRNVAASEIVKSNILVVSPIEADHRTLRRMLPVNWALSCVNNERSARLELRRSGDRFSVVLCERELSSGSWRDVLEEVLRMPRAPFFIISSRLADEHLWAEALNLGAYDVLSKPFEPGEVNRVLTSAWRRWAGQRDPGIQFNGPRTVPVVGGCSI